MVQCWKILASTITQLSPGCAEAAKFSPSVFSDQLLRVKKFWGEGRRQLRLKEGADGADEI